jgi:hypothetical protein
VRIGEPQSANLPQRQRHQQARSGMRDMVLALVAILERLQML